MFVKARLSILSANIIIALKSMQTISNMKKYLILVLCLSLCFACAPRQNENIAEQEVQGLMKQWLELWRTYDLNMLDEIFWNDPQLTYFSSEKRGLIKGFDALKPHHEGFGFVAGGKLASRSLWLEDIHITLHQATAVVDAIWYFGDKQMPRDHVQQGPCTFVIIKDEDRAKIAHVHFGNY